MIVFCMFAKYIFHYYTILIHDCNKDSLLAALNTLTITRNMSQPIGTVDISQIVWLREREIGK